MAINHKLALTYDDVLLIPKYSEVLPAHTKLSTKISKNIEIKIPILSSAMDTVTESETAIKLALNGGAGVVHKNLSIEKQAEEIEKVKKFEFVKDEYLQASVVDKSLMVGAAVGVSDNEFKRAQALAKAGASFLIIDTAHGHSKGVGEMLKKLKSELSIDIIAGNVATSEACQYLIDLGADGIKVGIGPGSICTTRVIAGVGVPQLYALLQAKEVCHKNNVPYIADGGIKLSGDIVKALAAGASTVMIGSLFAGTEESPGEMVLKNGRAYKTYRGMGSIGAMGQGSKDRYGQAHIDDDKKFVPEGVEGEVNYKGPIENILYQLIGGLRSGMGYLGAKDISELRQKAEFVQISNAALKESHPHDISIAIEAPNYSGKK